MPFGNPGGYRRGKAQRRGASNGSRDGLVAALQQVLSRYGVKGGRGRVAAKSTAQRAPGARGRGSPNPLGGWPSDPGEDDPFYDLRIGYRK